VHLFLILSFIVALGKLGALLGCEILGHFVAGLLFAQVGTRTDC
jgi:hypothetical protein